jgi:transcriptional regulator with XRE-family HTH domain
MQTENQFTVLENKTIGRNIAMYRKIRGVKATQVAEKLGLKESAYTRYERGEVAITVEMVQRVAELLKVDPLNLLTTPAGSFIESGNNSPNAIVALNATNCHIMSEQQTELLLKLMESITDLSKKIMVMLDKKS